MTVRALQWFISSVKEPTEWPWTGHPIPLVLEECREGAAFFFDLVSAKASSKISGNFNEPASAPVEVTPKALGGSTCEQVRSSPCVPARGTGVQPE